MNREEVVLVSSPFSRLVGAMLLSPVIVVSLFVAVVAGFHLKWWILSGFAAWTSWRMFRK